jgi:hypothetical protein
MRALPVLLLLAACHQDYKLGEAAPEPLSLTVTSPTYGAYLGEGPVSVEGTVSPADAQVLVNGVTLPTDADGRFATTLPFVVGERAMQVDVHAIDPDESLRQVIPVFDGVDPRLSDPGAMTGLLTPTGLDALEPAVASLVDAQTLLDQVFASLPALDTDYFDFIPTALTTTGTTVDLAPAEDAVSMAIGMQDVTLTSQVTVVDYLTFDLGVKLGTIALGAQATPAVDDDGMLTLSLHDTTVNIDEIRLVVEGFELPGWVMDLLVEPVTDFVTGLLADVVDLALDSYGTLPLGGPFAFDTDLLGTQLSVLLADVGAGTDGVGMGITVATGHDAATEMPVMAGLLPTTPAGTLYQAGLAVHEGLVNALLDDTLSSLLDLDLDLSGDYGELLGAGIANLPGGEQIPEAADGWCIGFHAGDARVARFVPGVGAPLAQVWMPDVKVDLQYQTDGTCHDWLEASVFVVLDLTLDGTSVNTNLDVPHAVILSYGADGVDDAEVATALTTTVKGLFGLFADQLSFDLGALGDLGGLGLPITVDPRIVSIEPLDGTGLYGVYMDVFGE